MEVLRKSGGIERAADTEAGAVHDVGVNHGGADVFVAEQLLDLAAMS
jgi:hypothetical protein